MLFFLGTIQIGLLQLRQFQWQLCWSLSQSTLILKHRSYHHWQLIAYLMPVHSRVWRSFLLRSRLQLLKLFLRSTWCQEPVNYWSVPLQRCHRQECWAWLHTLGCRSHAHWLQGSETWFPLHRRWTLPPLICNRKPRNHFLWHGLYHRL